MATLVRKLRQKEILGLTGWSRTTLWRRVRARKFPLPTMDSKRMPTWFETDVAEHQKAQREVAGLPPLEVNGGE